MVLLATSILIVHDTLELYCVFWSMDCPRMVLECFPINTTQFHHFGDDSFSGFGRSMGQFESVVLQGRQGKEECLNINKEKKKENKSN
jgi:hypothetical protein